THTESSSSMVQETGELQTDPAVRGSIDGLSQEDGSVLADLLTDLSLVGSYTASETNTATTTLQETRSALGPVQRNYQTVADAPVYQSASDDGQSQEQTVHSQSTESEQNGSVNLATGAYKVTVASQATNTVLGYDGTNQSDTVHKTGSITVRAK